MTASAPFIAAASSLQHAAVFVQCDHRPAWQTGDTIQERPHDDCTAAMHCQALHTDNADINKMGMIVCFKQYLCIHPHSAKEVCMAARKGVLNAANAECLVTCYKYFAPLQ